METHRNGTTTATVAQPAGRPATGAAGFRPDPETTAKARRRRFSAEEKLRVLQEADACGPGEVGALLRREGLYSSHVTDWRRQRAEGQLAGLRPKRRGRTGSDGATTRIADLEREVRRRRPVHLPAALPRRAPGR